jgi:hypothetical protein
VAISNNFLCDYFLLFATSSLFRVALELHEPRVQPSDIYLCPLVHSVQSDLGRYQNIGERNFYTPFTEIFGLLSEAIDTNFYRTVNFMLAALNSASRDTASFKVKGKLHPCTGTEALYRPYGPWGE